MSLPTLGFGILLLLQAALAQSAPHISYSDIEEDEEALMDKLASLSSRRGLGDAFESTKPIFADFDLPSMDYLGSPLDVMGKAGVSLPRKFAYRPNDVRFYLPASQFPSPMDYQQQQLEDRLRGEQGGAYKADDPQGEDVHTHRDTESASGLHYMKKSQPETVADGGGANLGIIPPPGLTQGQPNSGQRSTNNIPPINNESQSPFEAHPQHNPNYIMTSSHDVPNPIFTAEKTNSGISSFYYVAIIAACSAAIVVGVVAAGICWYRIHERVKAAADVDYPAYGVTGPSKDVSPSGGDRKLAQSAHMYHYQHQKQQMAALQKTTMQENERQGSGSDVESEDDNEDGDYTVYECPGLAGLCNSGEMEVKNPLYEDEPTPATPQVVPTVEDPEPASK